MRRDPPLQWQSRRDARRRGSGSGARRRCRCARRCRARGSRQGLARRPSGVASRTGEPARRRQCAADGDLMISTDEINFEADLAADRASHEPALVVDVEGFEGPLDLLLMLARQQKVDLARISILALANQYLAFIERARQFRLELAADYLVMAAWLA